MSTAERQDETAREDAQGNPRPKGPAQLQERRRVARRRRHLARVDLGLGLLAALILVLAAPGLAIAGLIALTVLVGCLVAFLLDRRRRSRQRDEERGSEG
jgi:Flp pilus assembly protein TadB